MTSPVAVTIGELEAHVIAEPNSPTAGNVTLPRMSSSAARARSSVSRATDWASSNCAGTVIVMSRVATSRPLVRRAVSVAVAAGPDAGRVMTPFAVTTAGLEVVHVICEPALVPNLGRTMLSTIALVRPRSIAAASSRTPATPSGSARAIASSSDSGRS